MQQQESSHVNSPKPSRREFLRYSGTVAATSALAGVTLPHVHAAEDNTIRLALIGCGGRGSGAAVDAFKATGGPVKLVAMADLFENRLEELPCRPDRAAPGQDGCAAEDRRSSGSTPIARQSTACGPATSRWPARLCRPSGAMHLEYAVEKGVQRVHGKVVRHRSGRHPADYQGRRGGGEEEPEDCRRPDVPPLEEPSGADSSASATVSSATSISSAPTAWSRWGR